MKRMMFLLFLMVLVTSQPVCLHAQDTLNLRQVTTYDFGFWEGECMTSIHAHDDYAIACFSEFTRPIIFDISDPENISELGTLDTNPWFVRSADFKDNYAFMPLGDDGLWIIDMSDPSDPEIISIIDDVFYLGIAYSCKLYGDDHLFVSGLDTIHIFDISDLEDPVEVNQLDTIGNFEDCVFQDTLMLFTSYSGTHIWDVSDLNNPVELGFSPPPPWRVTLEGNFDDVIAVHDQNAFVGGHMTNRAETIGFYLRVLDFSNPQNPEEIFLSEVMGGLDLMVIDDILLSIGYNAPYQPQYYSSESELISIDISDPSDLHIISSTNTPGSAWSFTAAGDNLLLNDGPAGITVYDISSPDEPEMISNYDRAGQVTQMHSEGSILYVQEGYPGLWIFNMEDPENPEILGEITQLNQIGHIHWSGDYLYASGELDYGDRVVGIFNVYDISNAEMVGIYQPDSNYSIKSVQVKDSTLYVGQKSYAGRAGSYLDIIDISEPEDIERVNRYALDHDQLIIRFTNNYLMLLGSDTLMIFDRTDPQELEFIESYNTSGDSVGFMYYYTQGDTLVYLYAAGYFMDFDEIGLRLFNVSNATNIEHIGDFPLEFDFTHRIYAVDHNENYLVLVGSNGYNTTDWMAVFNIRDLTSPELAGYISEFRQDDFYSNYMDVELVNGNIVTTNSSYITIYELENQAVSEISTGVPSTFKISQNYPNPFNSTTTISVELPVSSELKLSVYNIAGQEVAVLADERYSVGFHQFTFDASELSTGIYFIHVSVPGKMNEVRKVVLLK